MTRIIDFADGFTSATEPATEGSIASFLSSYANNAAYEAVHTAVQGSNFYDTTLDVVKVYDGSTWRTTERALDNVSASDPAVTDDSDDGYEVLSLWLNTSSGAFFRATDVSVGAAVWQEVAADAVLDSHISSTAAHGATGAVMGTTNSQVVTNKDIDGGTASNTSRITIPKADKTTLDGLTRKQGTVVYASDEDKLYADDGTDLNEIGSGGSGAGDADTIHLIEAGSLALISDVDLSGNNSDFDGGGTVTASSLSLSTTAGDLIKSAAVIKYDPNADGSDDYFGFTKTIPLGLRGRDIGFSFEYKNDSTTIDSDFRFCVKQKDGSGAGLIEYFSMEARNTSDDNSIRFSAPSFINSDCTEIEFGWQNTSSTTTVEIILDNILVSSNPFNFTNLRETQVYSIKQAQNAVTDRSTEIAFNLGTATETSTGAVLIIAEDDASARTKFIAQADITVHFEASAVLDSGSRLLAIALNDTIVRRGTAAGIANITAGVSGTFELVQGDYLTYGSCADPEATGFSSSISNFSTYTTHVDMNASILNRGAMTPMSDTPESYRTSDPLGYGSTATKIPYFKATPDLDTIDRLGTIVNDSTNGWSFTAKKKIRVNMCYHLAETSDVWVGISLNATATTGVKSVPEANVVAMSHSANASKPALVAFSGIIEVGDVLRPHNDDVNTVSTSNGYSGISLLVEPYEGTSVAISPQDYTQTKILSADTTATADVSDLTFNNLTIGKIYHLTGQVFINANSGGNRINYRDASSGTGNIYGESRYGDTSNENLIMSPSIIFKASSASLYVYYTTSPGNLRGDGTRSETFLTLTELNMTKETTRFS